MLANIFNTSMNFLKALTGNNSSSSVTSSNTSSSQSHKSADDGSYVVISCRLPIDDSANTKINNEIDTKKQAEIQSPFQTRIESITTKLQGIKNPNKDSIIAFSGDCLFNITWSNLENASRWWENYHSSIQSLDEQACENERLVNTLRIADSTSTATTSLVAKPTLTLNHVKDKTPTNKLKTMFLDNIEGLLQYNLNDRAYNYMLEVNQENIKLRDTIREIQGTVNVLTSTNESLQQQIPSVNRSVNLT
ncbi:MAG: hypothetical protein KIT27_02835 [Legionellales bacterium]|nr:hypothetical protein [Legionellales bacterium]